METINANDLNSSFSEVLKRLQAGEEIGILYRKKMVARLVPETLQKKSRRKIGIWDRKDNVKFNSDFKITDAEFLGI